MDDSKFDDISDYLQSHCQKTNAIDAMAKGNIPMYYTIFRCG